jgi:DNA-binding response OmpR family regulator
MSGELILVVDDEPNIIELARLYLERDGFRVVGVGDGSAALELVEGLRPALMVLDIMLPKLDGLEICKKLRGQDNSIPILMLTARDDDIDKILGLELGADDYLTKPFNPRELVARVKAVLLIRGDADKLAQVFSNLLDNAVKYSPPAGQVVLTSRLSDSWLEVQISDTGPGITPDEFERVFDRFYQMDNSRHGNTHGVGLGLAIAREIVIAHGGSISVINRTNAEIDHKNSQEQGSIFIVRLPI